MKVVFMIFVNKNTAYSLLKTHIHLVKKIIMKMPSIVQMGLIDLKTNSLLKMKFDEHASSPNTSDMIQFYRLVPVGALASALVL